jgi:DNA replicative helicase MCM subunit Mcm2 (Cdc46/Mcm family)
MSLFLILWMALGTVFGILLSWAFVRAKVVRMQYVCSKCKKKSCFEDDDCELGKERYISGLK